MTNQSREIDIKMQKKKCRHPMGKRKGKWIGFCLVKEWCGSCRKVLSNNFTKEEQERIPGLTVVTKG